VLAPYRGRPGSPWLRALLWLALPLACVVYGGMFALSSDGGASAALAAPVAALGLLAIWALPADTFPAPTQTVRILLLSYVVALLVWPNYLAIALPGLPWITFIRLIGFPLVIVFLAGISVSAEMRREIWQALTATPWLSGLVVAFFAMQVLSILESRDVSSSVNFLFVTLINWTAIYFISVFVFLQPGAASRWSVMVWVSALIVSVIALDEYREGHVIWAGHVPGFLQVNADSVKLILAGAHRMDSDVHRVSSTMSTSQGLGEFMALTAPFALCYLLGRRSWRTILAAIVSAPVLFLSTLASGARIGMTGFGIGVILLVFFWGAMRWRRNNQDIIGRAVVFAYPVFFALAVASSFFVGAVRKATWGGGQTESSTEARIVQWQMGIPKILADPLGYGNGLAAVILGYRVPSGMFTIDSYYLSLALDLGVLGVAIFIAMLAVAVGNAGRYALSGPGQDNELSLLAPACMSLAAFALVKTVFSQTDLHPFAFMVLGLVTALVWRVKRQLQAAGPRTLSARR
jgi:hypothetical protein